MKNVKEEAEKLARPFADELGLEIVEVEYARKHNGMNLTFFIDKEGGVTIDDCEKLHRAIDEPLDILDPTNGASYILNVSSLGIDRPLKTERDFARNAGKEIEVGFYAPVDGTKRIVGVLEEYDKEGFCIRTEKGGLVEIKYSAAASVKPVIKF